MGSVKRISERSVKIMREKCKVKTSGNCKKNRNEKCKSVKVRSVKVRSVNIIWGKE